MIYLDSALTKLIHAEAETAALQRYLDTQQDELVTCELALTEVPRVIRRVNHDAQRRLRVKKSLLNKEMTTATELLERLEKLVVDEHIFAAAGAYDADPHLGSLDTIHLVSALDLGPALSAFITYDKVLSRAASEAGINAVQPGSS